MLKKRLLALGCIVSMMASMTACSTSSGPAAGSTAAAATGQATAAADKEGSTDKGENAGGYTPNGDYNIRVFAAAGGVADTITRITAQSLQEEYGATMIVNNLTGASGAVAAADLDAYEPSIHEMAVVSMSLFTMAPLMNQDLKISLDDYEMVGSLIRDEFVLFVSKDSGIKTWEDLVEYGKNNQIIYASNTPGGNTHIVQTALFGEAGLDAQALTSDGSNKDILACMSGDAICGSATTTLAKPYVESGDIIPIGIFSKDVYTGYEGYEVPTMASLGYDITIPSYNFLITRAGVDKAEIDGFFGAVMACRETEKFKELAAASGYEPDNTDSDTLRAEIEFYAAECKKIYDKYYQ